MPDRHSFALSVVRFVLAFALLAAPWPGLGRAFTSAVGGVATALADPLFVSSNVTFVLRAARPDERLDDWRGVMDVKQDFPAGPSRHAGAIDLRRAGYLQLATFLSLAAGWPPPRRRRALAFVVSSMVVGSILAIPVLEFLSGLGAVRLGEWMATAVSLARRALVAPPGMAHAIPGLTWVALRASERPPQGVGNVPTHD